MTRHSPTRLKARLMFSIFKKKQQPVASDGKRELGNPILSFVLLKGDTFPVDDFLKQVAKSRFAGQRAANITNDGNVFSFNVGDEFIAISHMPGPYPAQDLEGPISTTWMWPSEPPIESVKQHRTFLLIAGTAGTRDAITRRLIVTAATTLAAKQPGVMAVYWPESTLVHFPPVFVQMAETFTKPDGPPLYLWVDLRAFRNDDGTTGLFTTGLAPLGHMEIEVPSVDMSPGDLREWLFNIMLYLIQKGPVLQHGQTIGMTAEHLVPITHGPSSFGRPGTVIRLG